MLLDAALGRANMSRVALADKLKSPVTGRSVTRQAVGNWLAGEHPSPELMGKLLAALDATEDERQALLAAYARETGTLPAQSVTWAAK